MNRFDVRTVNIKDLIQPITQIDTVEEIYLFGSRAYKTGSRRSDIDILVYAPKGVRQDEVLPIMENEKALDIFETIDKKSARSFANDSRLSRRDLIKALDAILLWTKEGYIESNITKHAKQKFLMDYDFKMSIMPLYTKEQEVFYKTFGFDCVFLIMPFKKELDDICRIIKESLKEYDIKVVRADDKAFSDELWKNVMIYMECCQKAISIFDKSEDNSFNPNVALETGYMLSKGAYVCLLKDSRLKNLPSDLISKLYKEYDYADFKKQIQGLLQTWLKEIHKIN